ncbi:MAG: hypothetical protein CFE44_14280 [Burkholderiales bacterium PBB4]|nr:MAG: hypothetical protein CFE44_14280 [Burkholderiales bacterium PBB4]
MAKGDKRSGFYSGDPVALREWQDRMGFTFEGAARALDIGRTTYAEMISGATRIDLRTAIACVALEKGLEPFRQKQNASLS